MGLPVQCVPESLGCCWPAGHMRQVVVCVAPSNQPAGQLPQSLCPGDDWNLPCGHALQTDVPSWPRNLPAGHSVHADCIVWSSKVPTAQALQTVGAASFWYWPSEQASQLATLVAALNVPEAHDLQVTAPFRSWNLASGHAVHAPLLGASYWPMEHETHAPPSEAASHPSRSLPASQEAHSRHGSVHASEAPRSLNLPCGHRRQVPPAEPWTQPLRYVPTGQAAQSVHMSAH